MSAAREPRIERPSFPWFLLTGLILGLVFGLVYAWLIDPVTYRDSAPDVLTAEQKDQYRRLVALSYASNHDVGRSAARLNLLGDEDPADLLSELAQQVMVEGGSGDEARALAGLAAALRSMPAAKPSVEKTAGKTVQSTKPEASSKSQVLPVTTTLNAPAVRPTSTAPGDAVRSATPQPTPVDSVTPAATFTPRPTFTPSPTPGAPFVLADSAVLCEDQQVKQLMQILITDSAGQAIPGMNVVITWDGGQEIFFTGLAPDISPGYADYQMQQDVTYSVRVGEGGEAVGGLSAPECKDSGGGVFYGGLKLTFKQP